MASTPQASKPAAALTPSSTPATEVAPAHPESTTPRSISATISSITSTAAKASAEVSAARQAAAETESDSSSSSSSSSAAAAPSFAGAASASPASALVATDPVSTQIRQRIADMRNSNKVQWSVVIMAAMLAAFGPVCTDIYLPATPAITAELNASAAQVQLSLTTCFLGLALGQLFIGPISDAYGRKKPLFISLAVFALASIACAFATNVHQLIVMRFLQGFSGAGGVVLARTLACDIYSGQRLTQFTALLMTINSLAPILGPIVGSAIVAFFDWPMLFVFLCLWGVFLILTSSKFFPETLPPDARSSTLGSTMGNMFHELKNKRFLLLSLGLGVTMGGFAGYLASSPFIFQVIFGLSPVGYAMIFGFNAIMLSVVANLTGRLAKRGAERKIVVWSLLIQIAMGFALVAVIVLGIEQVVLVAVILCVYVAIGGATQTAGFAIAIESRCGGAGAATGIFGVMGFFFGAISSPLVGLMGERSMVPLSVALIVSAALSLTLLLWGLHSKLHQNSPAAQAAASPQAALEIAAKQRH